MRLRFNEIKVKDLESTGGYSLFQSAENSLQAGITSYSRFSRPYYELALCELQMHHYTTARNLLDSSTQSSRRRTVSGKITFPYSDCL